LNTFGIGRRTFFKFLDEMSKVELEAKEYGRDHPPKVGDDDF